MLWDVGLGAAANPITALRAMGGIKGSIHLLSFDHTPYLDTIPLWLTGTIIGRDILMLAGMMVIQWTVGKVKVRPRVLGKIVLA